MNAEIISFGELLVDWVSTQPTHSLDAARQFEKAPGGAPANVAVALTRLGVRAAFVGGVSTDPFGTWLESVLGREGVDVTHTIHKTGTNTRMAYVLTDQSGDRRLVAFTLSNTADAAVEVEDVEKLRFRGASIFHYGSVSMAQLPAREATRAAVRRAREEGLLISFDPNIRLPLWTSSDMARRTILPQLSSADIIKLSEEELIFLTGVEDPEPAVMEIWERYRPLVVAVTFGEDGAILKHGAGLVRCAGFDVEAKDTTGAGDAFVGGLLAGLLHARSATETQALRDGIEALDEGTLSSLLRRCCACGALATLRHGAIPSLADSSKVDAFLDEANSPRS